MDGVLVIDKPSGPTSHDVVIRARAALGQRRIGHTGTLDPLATGVLPLVLGRATRLAQFLSAATKTYEATIRLGLVTDTYDVAGRVVEQHAVPATSIDVEVVERALTSFRGGYAQTPPPYSAKKIGGVRASDRARKSEAVVLQPVPVTVHDLELLAVDSDFIRLRVTASAGFYVRVLANELGAALGVGGSLATLRRVRSGDFDLAAAVTLESLERDPASAAARIVPLDAMLPTLEAVYLVEEGRRRALHGAAIRQEDIDAARRTPGVDESSASGAVRLLDQAGHLLAVAARRKSGAALHPLVVVG